MRGGIIQEGLEGEDEGGLEKKKVKKESYIF